MHNLGMIFSEEIRLVLFIGGWMNNLGTIFREEIRSVLFIGGKKKRG